MRLASCPELHGVSVFADDQNLCAIIDQSIATPDYSIICEIIVERNMVISKSVLLFKTYIMDVGVFRNSKTLPEVVLSGISLPASTYKSHSDSVTGFHCIG